ncbi:unnamed protein product [Gulo gulo]|uniref:Vomeronasal type-1 receptor n=1 Tax=Gulo gulo TaxID=48420 RepID=A0A9X9M7K0_GULGU|nr:unnamed protein product [Gulo gulo]
MHVTIKICQFLQLRIGILANTFLLLFQIFMLLLDHRPKPTDLIICHLALVHIMKLFIILFQLPTELFESPNFMNDFKCKVVFYMSRVMRGLSICTTCLLSIIQAITMSPSTSWIGRFKHKCTHYIFHSFVILWFLHLSISVNSIFYTVASSSTTNSNLLNVSKHCSLSPMAPTIRALLFTLTLSRDVYFVGVMLFSSAYMVTHLTRHQRRCQHLHSTSFSSKASPEKRATRTVLLLVSFFVVVYWVDFIISSPIILLWAYDPLILDCQKLLSNIYATVSSLVLICSGKRIKICCKNVASSQSILNKLIMK